MNNLVKDAIAEGTIRGLNLALKMAELQREENGDLDYLISSLKDLIREKEEE